MADLIGPNLREDEPYSPADYFRYGPITAPSSQVYDAQYQETLATNPTAFVARDIQREAENTPVWQSGAVTMANPNYVESALLDPADANLKYGITHNGKQVLKFDQPIRDREAGELFRLKREEILRLDILSRAEGGFWQGATRFAIGLGGSVIDPINVLSAFVPVVGPARYSAMVANASTLLGRTGVRAGVGALEGAVGAGLVEPINIYFSQQERRDYDMVDSLANIAFGSALGGGFHSIGGALGDLMGRAPIETKHAMLGEALTATLEGRPVRADLILREHLLGGTSRATPFDMARAEFDLASGRFVTRETPAFDDGRARFNANAGPVGPIMSPARTAEPLSIDMGGGIRVGVESPHPMPEHAGSSIPLLAKNDEPMRFTTEKYAQNAARRVEREQGFRPEIIKTADGFMLRKEAKLEPVYKGDGSVMVFDNERQAVRYRDQIMRDAELTPIKVRLDDGPVKVALVKGATEKDQIAAAKAPGQVELRSTKNVEQTVQSRANDIQQGRARFEQHMGDWLNERRNPKVYVDPRDAKALADGETRLIRARGEQESITRTGGDTERSLIEREIDDYDAQIKAIDEVGELSPEAKAAMADADKLVAEAEKRGTMFDRIAACIRGTA